MKRSKFKHTTLLSRFGLTLIEFLVVLVIILGILFVLIPVVRRDVRPAAWRAQCSNNLRQIGLALHNYHDDHGTFPPAFTVDADGKRLHSWRTLILPYVDQVTLYETIDLTKPWDDPVNVEALESIPQTYRCPSADLQDGKTTYLALVGEECVFPFEQARSIPEITDRLIRTAMVVDVGSENAVHWMSPIDEDETFFDELVHDPPGPHFPVSQLLLADGSTVTISSENPTEKIRGLATVAGNDDDNWSP